MNNEVIQLITKTADGTVIEEWRGKLYAEKKGVNRQEFYAAYEVGVTPKLLFIINLEDWEEQKRIDAEGYAVYPQELLYNGIRYMILRVYEGRERAELTVG